MTNWNRLTRWVIPICLLGAAVPVALSQLRAVEAPANPQGLNPESMYGKESAQGVYVRDSAVALEKFAQAQRMERLKEWAKAADLYQEVLEKFSDRVVPSQVDNDNNIYQYISVIAAVQQKMAAWPVDGLDVYRNRYEAAAAAIVDSTKSDDRGAMQQVLNRYFATETAKSAGMRLIDLYLESGEFSAAAWMGEQLLALHPNLIVERPRVMYRVSLAYQLAGEQERAQAKLQDLRNKHPRDMGVIRGSDTNLADSLATELSREITSVTGMADSSWPMFGGSPDRTRVSNATGRPGAKLYSIPLAKPDFSKLPKEQQMQFTARDGQDQDNGRTLGVMPVIDRGELFFQDGQRLYGVNVETGVPLPGWLATYPGDQKGQYQHPSNRSTTSGHLLTVTLTDKSVLAIMGQSDRMAQFYGFGAGPPGGTRLVCLDRATGKERWVATSRNLPPDSGLQNAEFSGSPMVMENSVVVSARSAKGGQFEDCYAICFDLETGKYKWNCYIASANDAAQARAMDGDLSNMMTDNIAQLAYANGRLYVLTNLGAVAAVDAYGGRIVWLSIYPRHQSLTTANNNNLWRGRMAGSMGETTSKQPWMNSPVFVDNGRVFVLPTDGRFLHVYDAGTGVETKRIDTRHFDNTDSLIAVMGSRLLLTGKTTATYVNWERYDINTFKPRTDPSIEGPKNLPSNVKGRAFVAGELAYVPTQEHVYVVQMRGGKVLQEYPKFPKKWEPRDDAEGPGNVLVSDDHLIIASNRRVDVYTDMDAARKKLDTEIAKNPTSPEHRLRYAEVMFVAGDIPLAMTKLDETIDLLGGRENLMPGPARDRLFNSCMNFTQKLLKDIKNVESDNVPTVEALFNRAQTAAYTPQQHVNYRLLRARFATTLRDHTLAVRLNQEILLDAEYRQVQATDEQAGLQTSAAVIARRSIDELMKKSGDPYKPFEQQANEQFETAKAVKNADVLANLATTFPNARVAPQALLAAAELKDAAGDPRGAVQMLRQLYLGYPNTPQKRKMLESLARNYLALPNRSSAAVARMAEAAKLGGGEKLSQPITLPGGRVIADVTLDQALAEMRTLRVQEAASALPDFKLPRPIVGPDGRRKKREPFLPTTPDLVLNDVQSLLQPHRDFSRPDRVAVYLRNVGVNLYASGSLAKPVATLQMTDEPLGITWTLQGPVIWTPQRAYFLRGNSGEPAWTFDTKTLPAAEVVTTVEGGAKQDTQRDPAVEQNGEQVVINGDFNGRVIIRGNRRIVVQNGVVRDMQVPNEIAKTVAVGGNETIVNVRPVGDMVLITTSSGRLAAVNLADGKIRWQTRLAERLAERMAADEDFVVLFQRDEATVTLTVLDTSTGQTIGRRLFNDGIRIPLNFALSPDGTLVYTFPDRIVLKNLYEPWSTAEREIIDTRAAQNGQMPYATSGTLDQLLIADGRVLAVADQGSTLRVFSMESGKPLRYTPIDSTKEVDMVLSTAAQRNTQVTVRVVGSQVYLLGPQSLIAYNLEKPDASWRMQNPGTGNERITEFFLGKEHLVAVRNLGTRVNEGKVAEYRLEAFARYAEGKNNVESGRYDYTPSIKDPSGIVAVQPAEGGFYYLTGDRKLTFLKSAGN